jgi:hypothetical protein
MMGYKYVYNVRLAQLVSLNFTITHPLLRTQV